MKIYDIAIVGAGAAGLTAAIYGLRAHKSVLVLEKTAPGGQILATTKIENYPGLLSISGAEFGNTLKKQVIAFGGEIIADDVLSIDCSDHYRLTGEDTTYLARSVILANGSRERRLGLPEEDSYISKGVSYCATCDGALYRGKTVAVYGGGNTAAYSVLYLANLAQKVFWIFRKPAPRAEAHLVAKIRNLPTVEVCASSVIAHLHGDKKLQSIEFADGNAINADGLFILIGREPDNARFGSLVQLDAAGYIQSDETCRTSDPGIFCAGDTRNKPLHQLVTATADGAVAASAAVKYLDK